MRARLGLALLLALSCFASSRARADGLFGWTRAQPQDSIALNMPLDGIVLVGSFVLWEGSQALRGPLAPKSCNICDGVDNLGLPGSPGNGRGSLNRLDAFFHDALTGAIISRKSADATSGVIAYVGAPVLATAGAIFFTGPHSSDWAGARATVIVFESLSISGLLGQTVKYGIARKRPFVRYGHGTDGATAGEGDTYNVNDPDSHFSTFSGHTAATASVSFSSAMCATLEESPAAPYLWAGAGTLTFVVGTLRIMSEAHYFTDVLGGAILGGGVGVLVPLLHRAGGWLGSDRDGLQISSGPAGGLQMAWAGRF